MISQTIARKIYTRVFVDGRPLPDSHTDLVIPKFIKNTVDRQIVETSFRKIKYLLSSQHIHYMGKDRLCYRRIKLFYSADADTSYITNKYNRNLPFFQGDKIQFYNNISTVEFDTFDLCMIVSTNKCTGDGLRIARSHYKIMKKYGVTKDAFNDEQMKILLSL